MILKFGRYKGWRVSDIREDRYLSWLVNPVLKSGEIASVAPEVKHEAARVLADRQSIREMRDEIEAAMRGDEAESLRYVIEREGDIDGRTIHPTLADALARIAYEYPITDDADGGSGRQTPDPEDDRILIWEVLPSGHRKVVWHFSGWHWDQDEYGPQGTLPGDDRDLYSLADF